MVKIKALEAILKEREKQYGSFTSTLDKIFWIKSGITINVTCLYKNTDLVNSSVEFIKNMLALKAARSVTATGASFQDCINDFINYYNLFKNTYNSEIILNNHLFSDNLISFLENQNEESLSSITEILKMENAKWILS